MVCIQFIEVIGYCHTFHDFFHTTPQAPFWYTMLMMMNWCDLGHMKGQWPQVRVRTYLQATWDLSTQYKPLMFLLYTVMNLRQESGTDKHTDRHIWHMRDSYSITHLCLCLVHLSGKILKMWILVSKSLYSIDDDKFFFFKSNKI